MRNGSSWSESGYASARSTAWSACWRINGSTGDTEAAAQTALRLLASDPLQEPIHRVLMRPYTALGRRPDALRQYHLCVTSLRRDLGVDPEVETKELYQTILRYRATARTTGVTVVDVAPDGELRWQSVDDVALIGRTSERALLVKAMDAAWAGRSGGVALLGEAGSGKTRLVSEIIGEARRRGGGVVAGRAFETEQVLPFRPWIDALKSGQITRDPQLLDALTPLHRAALGHVFPEVGAASPAGRFDFLRLSRAAPPAASRSSTSMLGAFDEGSAVAEELCALEGQRSDVTTHGHILVNGCIGLLHATRGELGPALARLESATPTGSPFARKST